MVTGLPEFDPEVLAVGAFSSIFSLDSPLFSLSLPVFFSALVFALVFAFVSDSIYAPLSCAVL